MTDKEFINTFNEYYPFERYIVKNPKKINYLFDDVLLTELFVPGTEIKPLEHNGHFVGFTSIDDEEIYVKLKTPTGEIRMAYYDFNDHIREEIRNIIISDFGGWEWESLYVECEEGEYNENLAQALKLQHTLVKNKYGVCSMKDNFIIEDTIILIQDLQ